MARIDVGTEGSVFAEYGGYDVQTGAIERVFDVSPSNPVATTTRLDLDIPPGAILDAARFVVVVDPPGRCRIGDVAEVRAVAPGSADLVIDLKAMLTVSEIALPDDVDPGILTLLPWLGTRFADTWEPIVPSGITSTPVEGHRSMAFQDVLTEKLLCRLHEAVAPESVHDGQLVLPSPPGFAEILINDVRAWFSPIGPASPRTLEPTVAGVHAFADVVDLTVAMQLALDADGALKVELRVSSPAQLQFGTDSLRFFRTYDVQFSEGPTRGFDAPQEGLYEVELPLPDEEATESWDVHAVDLTLRADIDDTRIQPPTGPPLATDVEIVLAESRTLLVKLPAPVISRFGALGGVRVPVRAGPAGGELAGELLRDDTTTGSSRPGEGIPDAALGPGTVPPSDDVAYLTLALTTPFEPAPDASEAVWCTLRATRGEVTWALSLPDPDDDLAGADLRWRAPNGSARSLSSFSVPGVPGATAHAGAVRIVGTRDANRPLDAVAVSMAEGAVSVSLTPFETGSPVRVDLADPVSPGAARSLRARFLVSAPGSYTIERARLIYTDPDLDTAPETDGGT